MRHNRNLVIGRATCALVLSCLLATSPLVDGIAAMEPAFADEPAPAPESQQPEGESPEAAEAPATPEASAQEPTAPEEGGQLSQDVQLEGTNNAGDAEGEAPAADDEAPAPEEGNRVTADVPLVEEEAPAATAGTVIVDGLKYQVNSDGETAELAGWHGAAAPEGDVTVAARVVSGADEYAVTKVAKEALKGCDKVESVVLPDTLAEIGKDAFKGCSALRSIVVGEANEKFASHDGMLFSKDLTTLVLCPEGKGSGGGASLASLPAETTALSEDAFSGCTHLTAIAVDEKNAAFANMGGMLLSKDLSKLVYAPAGIGASVTVPVEVREVAAGAFSECGSLNSIVAPGNVETIGAGAFPVEVVANATVALAPGEDYDARKAVWQDAGFTHFSEPAAPGEVTKPSQEKSGFAYRLLDDFTLAVSWEGEGEPEADLVLPTSAEIDGVEYRVTAVAANGFQGRTGLSTVEIRAPITTIGDGAFDGCSNLASIELPDGVDYVGSRAFAGTTLASMILPASVKTVAPEALANCSKLGRIVALSNSLDVAPDAIAGCTNVSVFCPYNESGDSPWNPGLPASGNHVLPYGLALAADPLKLEVDQSADLFEDGLCEVPEGCELAYSYAATPISVDAAQVTGKKAGTSEVTAVLTLDGVELARATRTVEVVPASEPQEESADQQDAPSDPEAVEEPQASNQLERPQILSMTVPLSETPTPLSAATDVIYDQSVYPTLTFTKSGTSASVKANTSNKPTGVVRVPKKVKINGTTCTVDSVQTATSAANSAFGTCSGLEEVVLPSTVTYIGEYAFTDNKTLKHVDMPNVGTIGQYAFKGCSSLSAVVFSQQLGAVGKNAFQACTSLTSVSIPFGWDKIWEYTFEGCSSLSSVYFADGISGMADYAFANCALKSVTLPKSVGTVGNYVFKGNPGVEIFAQKNPSSLGSPGRNENIVWIATDGTNPTGWQSAGYLVDSVSLSTSFPGLSFTKLSGNECSVRAGSGIGNITDLVIPAYVSINGTACAVTQVENATIFSSGAFSGCSNLKSVKLPGTLEFIGAYAFYRCSSLVSVDMPAGVSQIDPYAFQFCSSLKSIILPSGNLSTLNPTVTLDEMTFQDCTSLSSVYIPNTITSIPSDFFSGCSALSSITIPESVSWVGSNAFKYTSTDIFVEGNTGVGSCGTNEATVYAAKPGVDLSNWEAAGYKVSDAKDVNLYPTLDFTPIGGNECSVMRDLYNTPTGDVVIPSQVFIEGKVYNVTKVSDGENHADFGAFNDCSGITSITLPEDIGEIDDYSFRGCTGLSTIVMPRPDYVGVDAFDGCNIDILITGDVLNVENAGSNGTKRVYLASPDVDPEHLTKWAKAGYTTSTEMHVSVKYPTLIFKKLEDGSTCSVEANPNNKPTGDLNIPAQVVLQGTTCTVTEVAKNGFAGCTLGTVTLPETMKTLSSYAFSDCTIGPVSLPNGLTSIGDHAFYGTWGPEDWPEFVIPSSVLLVGAEAFGGGNDFRIFTYAKGVFGIGAVTNFKGMVHPANPTLDLSKWSAAGYTVMDSVPASCMPTLIFTPLDSGSDEYAVEKNPDNKPTGDVVIPGKVYIDGLEYTVTTIKYDPVDFGAFAYCTGITSLTLPNTITDIDKFAFQGCTGLSSLTIPSSVKNVGEKVFEECKDVKIYLKGTPTSVGSVGGTGSKRELYPDVGVDTAKWKAAGYTVAQCYVTFSSNGGSAVSSQRIDYNSTLTKPADPTKDGYTFKCWRLASTDPIEWDFSTPVSNLFMGLDAEWTANTYTVTYNVNSGSGTKPADQLCTYDVNFTTQPSSLTRTGYKFAGWNTKSDGTGATYGAGTTQKNLTKEKNGTVTLYAKWAGNQYQINFNANNGTGGPGQMTVTYGSSWTVPSTEPTRTGYTFLGWSTSNSATATATYKANTSYDTHLTTDATTKTLYAVWKANTYTYTFYGNGETSGSMSPQTVAYGQSVTLTPNAFSRTGYTFAGWRTSASGPGPLYKDEHEMTGVTKDFNFYAQWTPNVYTIRYLSNGGSGYMPTSSKTYGENKKLSKNLYTRDGYTFAGWATTDEGVVEYPDEQLLSTDLTAEAGKTIDLYAVWTPKTDTKYTIVHWTQRLDKPTSPTSPINYEPNETVEKRGTTGTSVQAPLKSIDGFTAPAAQSVTIAGDGSSVVNYYYTRNSYKFTLGTAKGVSTSGSTVTGNYQYGATINLSAVAEPGYTFSKWTSSDTSLAAAPASAVGTFTMPAGAVTMTPSATVNTYTIDYELNGGTQAANPPTSYTVESAVVTLPSNPTRVGYDFAGWYDNASFTGNRVYTIPAGSTGDKVFHAKWNIKKYTVSFVPNNGGTVAAQTINHGAKATSPSVAKTGHTLEGWYTDSKLTNKYDFNMSVTSSFTLFAKWIPITYTIHFNGNGSTGGSMNDLSMTYGVSKNLTSNGFTRTGHRFLGWAIEQGSSNVAYTDGQSVSNLLPYSGTVQLWAVWDANSYNVTFNSHSGTPVDGLSVKYGQKVTKPTPNPSKTGYTFDNWYKEATYATLWNFDTDTMPADALELHAKWNANAYEVVFDANNGTGVMQNQVYTYDKSANLHKSTMTRAGYTFTGWNTEANGSGTPYTDEQSVMNLAESGLVRLFAQWTPITYTVSFDANGGTGTTAQMTKTYGTDKALTSNGFSRTGYTFAGWARSSTGPVEYADGQNLTADLTTEAGKNVPLFAKWTPIQTKVSFDPTDGAGGQSASVTATYDADMPAISTTPPTRTGYSFYGWWDTASGNGIMFYNPECKSNYKWNKTTDWTLYARWKPKTYTITFDANNGTGAPANVTATYDADMPAISATPKRTGYTFAGWWDTSEATGGTQYYTSANASARTWNKDANKTLYARWTPRTDTAYTVVHWIQKVNGDASQQNSTNYSEHSRESLTGTTATSVSPARRTITGFTSPDAQTVAIAANGSTVVNYYYTRNSYDLTFDTDGGSTAPTKQSVLYEGKGKEPDDPTKDGYAFGGWYTGKNGGGSKWDFATSTMPAQHVMLYAKWNVVTYNIDYELNGGTEAANTPKTYTVEAAVTLPTEPKRTGYTFAGWYGNEELTGERIYTISKGTTGDKRFFAKWTLILSYTLPTSATVAVDATGKVTAGTGQKIKSDTVVPIKVTGIACAELSGATSLLPALADRQKLLVNIKPKDKSAVSVGLGKSLAASALGDFVVPAKSELALDFSLTVPPGSKLAYLGESTLAEIAQITYTIQAVS